jgi:hypothetical protein
MMMMMIIIIRRIIIKNNNCKSLHYDQVKEDEMDRACSTNGEKRNAYRILVEMPKGKRPLGRPRCR